MPSEKLVPHSAAKVSLVAYNLVKYTNEGGWGHKLKLNKHSDMPNTRQSPKALF